MKTELENMRKERDTLRADFSRVTRQLELIQQCTDENGKPNIDFEELLINQDLVADRFMNELKQMEARINTSVNEKINLLMTNTVHANVDKDFAAPSARNGEPWNPSTVANKSNQFPNSSLTYAEALKKSKISPESIRNIRIMGDERQCRVTMDLIRKDDMCVDLPIVSIANKGRQNLTIKCPDPATALTFEELMKNKYKANVQILKITPTSPRVKITPILPRATRRKK